LGHHPVELPLLHPHQQGLGWSQLWVTGVPDTNTSAFQAGVPDIYTSALQAGSNFGPLKFLTQIHQLFRLEPTLGLWSS